MRRRQFLTLALGGSSVLLAGCGAPGGSPGGTGPGSGSGVLEVARAQGATSFVRAVETAGLTDRLSGAGPYTLFVPSNAAFATAGQPRDQASAARVIAYHVVPGMVSTSFMGGMDMNHLTSTGAALNVDGRGDRIRVDGRATITRADLPARNGVVHMIDRVLVPS